MVSFVHSNSLCATIRSGHGEAVAHQGVSYSGQMGLMEYQNDQPDANVILARQYEIASSAHLSGLAAGAGWMWPWEGLLLIVHPANTWLCAKQVRCLSIPQLSCRFSVPCKQVGCTLEALFEVADHGHMMTICLSVGMASCVQHGRLPSAYLRDARGPLACEPCS